MTSEPRTYGASLPDQVDCVANLSDAQCDIFGDIREIYKDRAALEREYATKLQTLAKKTLEKKTRKMASAILGNDTTKPWNEDTLRLSSTIENAYSKIIGSLVNSAQEHIDVSDALNMQVVDVLRNLERKNEEHRKRLATFYQKMLSDRDRVYSERVKYDDECGEVETYRQKQERANDDKHAERAARQFEQQQIDMLNAKNVYLLTINIANKVQERFYSEDLPSLQNQYQHLQTYLTNKFISVLNHAQALQSAHYDTLKNQIAVVEASLKEVDIRKDQDLFIEYNIRPYTTPISWAFEPCASHYDTGEISVEGAPKIYLQNKLGRSRAKLQELSPLLESKKKEADHAMNVVNAYENNQSLGSVDDAMETYLEARHEATLYDTSRSILEAEIKLLEGALEGDEGSQSPHTFKSSSFTIPTECAHCKTSIWGLSRQGKTCKLCGVSVHAKCELKIAADCTRERGTRHKHTSSLSRAGSVISSLSTSSLASKGGAVEHPKARVLFSYTPTSPFELQVHEGMRVSIIEEDDGSGWVKVADGHGGKGLVPASYVEVSGSPTSSVAPETPTAAPSTGQVGQGQSTGKRVRCLYDYEAQGDDELGFSEGDNITLTPGGEDYADGWWEGVSSTGRKGIFPSNYVCFVSFCSMDMF
ncbi:hypothetical protein OF83DRAFT_1161259 [Amylostereum chailletii]|nr:hypothetical protein OF83DRAFT_1161259 [Amylostereum chailletii]